MNICSDELRIRNALPEDGEQLAAWWNDGRVMAHAGFPRGLGTTAEEVASRIAEDSDGDGRRLIIEYAGRPIGEMSYSRIGGQTAEIGIKICEREYREKGLGRRLLSLFIRELFSMGFEKIVLDTNLKNHRAQHVYELLGFERKRVHICAWRDQLGKLQSSVDYELRPESFRDLSGEDA